MKIGVIRCITYQNVLNCHMNIIRVFLLFRWLNCVCGEVYVLGLRVCLFCEQKREREREEERQRRCGTLQCPCVCTVCLVVAQPLVIRFETVPTMLKEISTLLLGA